MLVYELLIPAILGILIPFVTRWITTLDFPTWVETALNFALSATAAVLPTVAFNGDWKAFLAAFGVAWLATMRSHYTQLPAAVYSKWSSGRHEKPDAS